MTNRIKVSMTTPSKVEWEPIPDGKSVDPLLTNVNTVDIGTVVPSWQLDTPLNYLEGAKYTAVALQDFELAAKIRDFTDSLEDK